MTRIEIERAVEQLSPEEFAKFEALHIKSILAMF